MYNDKLYKLNINFYNIFIIFVYKCQFYRNELKFGGFDLI